MKNIRTKAIALRRVNYGEADRIVTFLTPAGQVSAMARGARREKSKLAGAIELLAVSDITMSEGKGSLSVITSARLECFYDQILRDYDRLEFAYQVLKVAEQSSRDIDESDWYDVSRSALEALNTPSISLELVETWFLLRAMEMNGEPLNLATDIDGNSLQPDKIYAYDTLERAFRPDIHGKITADHIKLLRIIATKPFSVLTQIGGIEPYLEGCRGVVRQL